MSIQNKFSQDNVYYNVEMLGAPVVANQITQQMIYDVTLNNSIVDNSVNYYLSIVDFAIPLSSVPIMIAPILPNSGLTNEMTLNLNFVVNGVVMPSISLIFVPERTDLTQPNQTNPNKTNITPYYFLYSYDSLIKMLNTAVRTAYNAMVAAYPLIIPSNNQPPIFIYDSTTQLISLITHNSYSTNEAHPDIVYIQINEDLTTYLESFTFTFLKRNNLKYSQFQIINYNTNGYPTNTYPALPNYIKTIENYNSLNEWSDLKKIIIGSNSLPIAGESIQRNGTLQNVVNNEYILSSFTPELINAGDSRGIIYYSPTSQYRLLDITSDVDIRRIDVIVYFEDYKNNWYIMDLLPNDNVTIRLAFIKKDLYKSNLLKKM